MEKRVPLAILLSFLIFMVWSLFFAPRPQPLAPGEGSDAPSATEPDGVGAPDPDGAPALGPPDEPAAPVVAAETEERFTVDFGAPGSDGHYRATFSNRGGRLTELRTSTYVNEVGLTDDERAEPEHWVRLVEHAETNRGESGSLLLGARPSAHDLVAGPLSEALWEHTVERDADGAPTAVVFRHAPGTGVLFEKRVARGADPWTLDVSIALEHLAESPDGVRPGPRAFWFRPAGVVPSEQNGAFYPEPRAIAIGDVDGPYRKKSVQPSSSASDRTGAFDLPTPLAAVGVHNKYFAVLAHPSADDPRAQRTIVGATWERLQDRAFLAANPGAPSDSWRFLVSDALIELELPERGERRSYAYELYAGPKKKDTFVGALEAHKAVVEDDLAWFSSIGNVLLDVLRVLERFTGNWGVAIILLTLMIRLVLFPLNRRSQTAMARYAKKMKRVQPMLKAVQEKYKDDPKKLREEQGRIMQEEGAFPPLGGCLPLFLQMPIFFGLFSALRSSFDLRQAPFVSWIQDLSHPDELFYLGWDVPFIGLEYFNLLPVLMTVLWVWQQRTMPTPDDEQSRRMQRMMLFMPIVMGVFLYNYAAGLSLYMMTQSGLGIFEQKVIKKFWPIDDKEPDKPQKSGCGCAPFAKAMERAAEQQKHRQQQLQGGKQRGGRPQPRTGGGGKRGGAKGGGRKR